MARPTVYNETIVPQVRQYLETCIDEEKEFHATRGEKSDTYQRRLRVRLPTIEGLAVHLHISRETIYQWKKEYKEFSDIIDELMAKQAEALVTNGLSGDYNPTIAKVLLTKHGYREGLEQTGKDGEPLILPVEIINKNALNSSSTNDSTRQA